MKRKEGMPSWAYLGLWGINSRKTAIAYLTASIVFSMILVPLGFYIRDYVLLIVLVAPVWYWLAIKWADDHAAWVKAENSYKWLLSDTPALALRCAAKPRR